MTDRHDTGTEPHTLEPNGWRGYVATCTCGWQGQHRADPKRAREDAASHQAATDRRPYSLEDYKRDKAARDRRQP